VYHGQRVHVFRPSLSFLAEAQPRLEKQARTKGTFWQRCTLNFLGDHMNYKAKDIIGKITNLFCIYLFQIHTLLIHNINIFFIVFVISLPTKLQTYYVFATQLLIYIIYGDRTIIGFVGFVANLLNRPIDSAMVSVRKRVTFRPLVST
jgi:hypothetical protein